MQKLLNKRNLLFILFFIFQITLGKILKRVFLKVVLFFKLVCSSSMQNLHNFNLIGSKFSESLPYLLTVKSVKGFRKKKKLSSYDNFYICVTRLKTPSNSLVSAALRCHTTNPSSAFRLCKVHSIFHPFSVDKMSANCTLGTESYAPRTRPTTT